MVLKIEEMGQARAFLIYVNKHYWKIVCPDRRYNKRTVNQLTQQILLDITPVSSYTQVNELSYTSVKWESLIEVDSFRSFKEKRSKNSRNRRKDTKPPHLTTSPSQSQDASTILSINSSKSKRQQGYDQYNHHLNHKKRHRPKLRDIPLFHRQRRNHPPQRLLSQTRKLM